MTPSVPAVRAEPPLVSIIIPTYNQAKVIHQAIEGALSQDYSNLEVVVVDDCSSDNTSTVVGAYLHDLRLKYFRNQINLGRVRNYKKALEQYATGEWVVNCDGDDYYINDRFISDMMAHIEDSSSENIVFAQGGRQVRVRHQPDHLHEQLPPISGKVELLSGEEYFWQLPHTAYFSHLTTVYKREIAIAIDFYRYDILSADRESFLRLALHGDVLLIKEVYGAWVQHDTNTSQNLDFETRHSNIAYILGSYRYALQIYSGHRNLESWRKKSLVKYYKQWLSRVAMQDVPLGIRLTELRKIMDSAIREHNEVCFSVDFYKTVVSLVYKLI